MRRLVEAYAGVPGHRLDHTALLHATNIFTGGRDLVWDEAAHRRLRVMLAEAEARADLDAALRCLAGEKARTADEARLSCELELWAFFERHRPRWVLHIGCGAYPQVAIQALRRLPWLRVDGIDNTPHCTVLCSRVAERLDLADRLRARTLDGGGLDPATVGRYDGFFISNAVRPKRSIIELLIRWKAPGARIYAREDAAHPQFYEPVEVTHPDLTTARAARRMWREATGSPAPVPLGCELPPG